MSGRARADPARSASGARSTSSTAAPTAATAARRRRGARQVPGLNTPIDFRYTQYFGPAGQPRDGRKNRTGAGAPDLVIEVPVGTQELDEEREEVLADFTEVGQRVVLLEGGIGGRGNASYATSTNRALRQHQPGMPAQELRPGCGSSCSPTPASSACLAAGKSTFINQASNTRAKVGDYASHHAGAQAGVVRSPRARVRARRHPRGGSRVRPKARRSATASSVTSSAAGC